MDIRRANIEDAKLLFDWRNDPTVRKASFNTEPISWEDHIAWFSRKIKSGETLFYIFSIKREPVGLVRINKDDESTLSISIDKNFRGKGLSVSMLKAASGLYFDELKGEVITAYVKTGNVASENAFKKAGFKQVSSTQISGAESGVFKLKRYMLNVQPWRRDRVFIIAELSANHRQDIEVAKQTIRAAKEAGADAIKLQTFTPDTITLNSNNNHFVIHEGTPWDGQTLYELYNEAYMPWEWHKELFDLANELGIYCFSSPFDITAVDFLEQFNPPAYKIASFEITDIPLIEYVASKGRPIIISTGIATISDIELALETCRKSGNYQVTLLKCTSSYPAPLEDVNLRVLNDLEERFNVTVGVSDHTLGTVVPVSATALGASVIEKHIILDKSLGGPDAGFSLDPLEFAQMVNAVRETEMALGRITYQLTDKTIKNRKFARSLFAVEDIKPGERFSKDNIRSVRPGDGLHPKYLETIVGREATKQIVKGQPLSWDLIKSENDTK